MEHDEIEMENTVNEEGNSRTLKIRKPKRILHFSDGVMEEYSDAEEDECDSAVNKSEEHVNVKDLRWGPYLRFKAHKVGSSVLSGMEYVGGGLASIFGITQSEADLNAIKERDTAYATKKRIEEENSKTWNSTQINDVVDDSPRASTSARIA